MEHFQKTKLLVYYGFLFFLLLHFAVKFKYSEPYPSLIFPSFSNAPDEKDNFIISTDKLYAITPDQDTLSIDEQRFFKGVFSHHIPFLTGKLKKKLSKAGAAHSNKDFRNYTLHRLKEQYPGTAFTSLLIQNTQKEYKVIGSDVLQQSTKQKNTSIGLQ